MKTVLTKQFPTAILKVRLTKKERDRSVDGYRDEKILTGGHLGHQRCHYVLTDRAEYDKVVTNENKALY